MRKFIQIRDFLFIFIKVVKSFNFNCLWKGEKTFNKRRVFGQGQLLIWQAVSLRFPRRIFSSMEWETLADSLLLAFFVSLLLINFSIKDIIDRFGFNHTYATTTYLKIQNVVWCTETIHFCLGSNKQVSWILLSTTIAWEDYIFSSLQTVKILFFNYGYCWNVGGVMMFGRKSK